MGEHPGEFLLALVGAFLLGAGVVSWVWERAFSRVARWQRVGQPDAPETRPGVTLGSPVNTEASAQRRITKDSIERGADELQRVAKDQGASMSRGKALEEAAHMLSGLHPLGGAG